MARLEQVQKITKINPKATYLLLISPDEIPHLAIVQDGNYFSLTHKKVIINEPFSPYFSFLKRTKRKMLFLEVRTNRTDLESVFKQYTKAAPNEMTCLVPVQQYLLKDSQSEFVYELIPELQAANLIQAVYQLNLEEDLTESGDFNLNEYSKAAIFSYIDSLNSKHVKR